MRLLPLLLLSACLDYDLSGKDEEPSVGSHDSGEGPTSDTEDDAACAAERFPPEPCGTNEACDYGIGGFTPIVEEDIPGENSLALPVVPDLDGDDLPEISVDWCYVRALGTLAVYRGVVSVTGR